MEYHFQFHSNEYELKTKNEKKHYVHLFIHVCFFLFKPAEPTKSGCCSKNFLREISGFDFKEEGPLTCVPIQSSFFFDIIK